MDHPMCYSASASFMTSAVLFSSGIYTIYQALKYHPSYFYIALIPIFFAIQQATEGLIWLTLEHPALNIQFLEKLYLFFAFFFWPSYISWATYKIEIQPKKQKKLLVCLILGLILGVSIYIPILFGWIHFKAFSLQHSICYNVHIDDIKLYIYSLTYLSILFIVTFISSNKKLRIFGIFVLIAFITTMYCFRYAFASIWCYMAAITSIYLFYVIPRKKEIQKHGKI